MSSTSHQKIEMRARRIAGQIAGIQKMIADDRYCIEILNQISAVRSALDALGVELLASHLKSCVLGHGSGSEHKKAKPMKTDELLNELQTALSRFLR